jgi:hypothetical protein
MTIEYSLWQGSRLLSIGNTATSIKDIDKVVAELNDSAIGKALKFSANVMKVEVK